MSNIKVKKDEQTGELYIDFSDIADMFEDPSIVEYYTVEESGGSSIVLEFFDKDKNPILPVQK
jgi:hypothetical protein